jgi:alkylation response protein AidB-like acyl-CoA dehydrogenase
VVVDPLNLTPDSTPDELRAVLRAWIEASAPAGLREVIDWNARVDLPGSVGSIVSEHDYAAAQQHPAFRAWERVCLDARLVCPSWPVQYGGRGWEAPQMTVLDEEFFRAGVPRVDRVQGESMVGPSVRRRSCCPRSSPVSTATARGSPSPAPVLTSRRPGPAGSLRATRS